MKKFIAAVLTLIMSLSLFASCAKAPTEEVTTGKSSYEAVNPMGSSEIDKNNGKVVFVPTEGSVDIVTQNYFKYKNNYASIENVKFDSGVVSANLKGFADVKTIKVSSRSDDMLIGFKAYDAKGNVLKEGYIKADLKGIRSGKTVEGVRFDVPFESVKIEFFDYTEQ